MASRRSGARRDHAAYRYEPGTWGPAEADRLVLGAGGRWHEPDASERKLVNQTELDQLCINTVRFLAVDMVENANSGHPGVPLGAAPMAYVLWTRFLRHNPEEPGSWIATASCSPPDTPRRCCTRCST